MRVHRVAAVALLVVLDGCGSGDGQIICTTEARPSVVLTVIDNANAPLSGVTVSYQVDGGAVMTLTCDSPWAVAVCDLGRETAGSYSIVAMKAGYASATATVFVDRDECHVITERVTLALTPVG